jgi:PAS domain S-box-containing protein
MIYLNTEMDNVMLRQKALTVLKNRPLKSASDFSADEMIMLIHEMEVLQIELELQNEELILARSIAQISSDKYLQLYDFAPSGYLTLSEDGEIIELNHSVEDMLGKKGSDLIKNMFGFFITDDTKPVFNLFLQKAFQSNVKEYCEVTLSTINNVSINVKLTGIVIGDSEQCLVNLNDITETKKSEY